MEILNKYSHIQMVCPTCSSLLKIGVEDVKVDDVGAIEKNGPYYCRCVACHCCFGLKNRLPHSWIKAVRD